MHRFRQSTLIAVCVAVLLIGSTHAQIHDQCMNYFGGLGGKDGIVNVGRRALIMR